jgi:hypothetical protein
MLLTYHLHSLTVHVSLITAIIPRIHGFLATLQTGRIVACVEPPDSKPSPADRFRSYLGKLKIDSAHTHSTDHSESTSGSNDVPLKLVPNHDVHLHTRIYSSHSGGSNASLTTRSSEAQSQVSEHRDARAMNMSTSKQLSINQRRDFTVNVEYLKEQTNSG